MLFVNYTDALTSHCNTRYVSLSDQDQWRSISSEVEESAQYCSWSNTATVRSRGLRFQVQFNQTRLYINAGTHRRLQVLLPLVQIVELCVVTCCSLFFKWLPRKGSYLDCRLKYRETFEMWCWRRMEKIGWTDDVKNEVSLKVREERSILCAMKRRKAKWSQLIGTAFWNTLLKGRPKQPLDGLKEKRRYFN